jgi:hypothetical protein
MIEVNNIVHGAMIGAIIPRPFNPDCDKVISNVERDGKLLGGVIYDGFTGNCIFMHQGGFEKNWLTKDMLWVVFDYPFNQLGVGKVCGTIRSSRKELLAFNERLGFIEECRVKDAYAPGDDMIVLSMTPERCRWLRIKPTTIHTNKVAKDLQ